MQLERYLFNVTTGITNVPYECYEARGSSPHTHRLALFPCTARSQWPHSINPSTLSLPSLAQRNSSSNRSHLALFPLPTNTATNSWDTLYTREISNHAADPSDIGTVWFDDSDAETKILDFLDRLADGDLELLVDDLTISRDDATFLDLGCGNGSLLFALRDESWPGRALGVDYSPQSIALARQITVAKQAEADAEPDADSPNPVEFQEWDVIAGPFDTVLSGPQADGWDIVLDKGTFDAICLSDEQDAQGRRLCEGYRDRVLHLVKKGGIFLVTSCNWTESELQGWFERRGDDGFDLAGKVEYKSFSFGGAKGQTISTLCFRRV
ncbi:hypothetical protein AUP68_01368 [Ilyonectria robusta]